ncbi:hypothetical protein [Mycobacterium sp.]|uniref:hypothetical protein n=1 Tax=Mycobacterium sp. TaxID=1785 RepID=UPI003BAF48EE
MADYNEHSNYGDPETDPDAALLDDELRDLLTDFPAAGQSGNDLPAAALSEISDAVRTAWPDGHPPTPEELAAEDAGNESPGDISGFESQDFHIPHDSHYSEFDHPDAGHPDYSHEHPDHGHDFT